jgi:hypothetical protein
VLASCELEPNNWPNRLPIEEEPVDELPDEPPNMLPPPQPDRAAPAATASAATAARFKRLTPAIIASIEPEKSRDGLIAGQTRRTKGASLSAVALVNRENLHPAGHTGSDPARRH